MYCGSVIVLIASLSVVVYGNTECVWATGKVICNKNQTLVLGTVVELFDMDGPSKVINSFSFFVMIIGRGSGRGIKRRLTILGVICQSNS